MKPQKNVAQLVFAGSVVALILSLSYYFYQSGRVARETAKTIEFGLFR